jgi:hypothetical protein
VQLGRLSTLLSPPPPAPTQLPGSPPPPSSTPSQHDDRHPHTPALALALIPTHSLVTHFVLSALLLSLEHDRHWSSVLLPIACGASPSPISSILSTYPSDRLSLMQLRHVEGSGLLLHAAHAAALRPAHCSGTGEDNQADTQPAPEKHKWVGQVGGAGRLGESPVGRFVARGRRRRPSSGGRGARRGEAGGCCCMLHMLLH